MTKTVFRILSLTWGLPLTVCGLAVAALLRAAGHRPRRYGPCLCFSLGRTRWGGLNLGPVLLVERDAADRLRRHELGHALQNIRYGPLMLPFFLASAARYHHRRRAQKRGRLLPPYDAWWFEGQATRLGTAYVASLARRGGICAVGARGDGGSPATPGGAAGDGGSSVGRESR